MSKKMGISYLTANKKNYYKRKLQPFLKLEGGEQLSMPRYFKDKIFTDEERKEVTNKTLQYVKSLKPRSANDEHAYKIHQFFKTSTNNRDKRNKL